MRNQTLPAPVEVVAKDNGKVRSLDLRRDILEELADQFADLHRRTGGPTIDQFAEMHPRHADDIRELFPLVLAMEQRARCSRQADGRASYAIPYGTRLGDFEIVAEIGRGGMGVVYEAEQISLGRRVAVKVLTPHSLHSQDDVDRFQREAQTAAGLHHTNIVPIFGVGEQRGTHYIAMQLIRGVGLDEVVRELQRITQEQCGVPAPSLDAKCARQAFAARSARGLRATDYFRNVARLGQQVASALDHAHLHGILHRDIKPANLLLDGEGVVWVADFGLAKSAGHDNLSHGDVVGTLRYVAPERFHEGADAQSDVYSLGVTLYELLTLQDAFTGGDRPGLVRRITQGELSPPRKKNPQIPRDLQRIVLRAVACEPSQRYRSAAELADDLACFLSDLPLKTRRVPTRERLWRWCRRNPLNAALAGSALSLLLVATVLAGLLAIGSRKNYVRESQLRERAESTTQVAIDVLDRIYAEFAPHGLVATSLNASQDALSDDAREDMPPVTSQPFVSNETALVLENLLAFYDRLAEEGGDDEAVLLKSANASGRIGEIHRQLGNAEKAQGALERALSIYGRLGPPSELPPDLQLQMAAIHNHLGIVAGERRDHRRSHQSYRDALQILESLADDPPASSAVRYELARTYYLMGSQAGWMGRGRPGPPQTDRGASRVGRPATGHEYLRASIGMLQSLRAEDPSNRDYRHLMARCLLATRRPRHASRDREEQAIEILTKLAAEFPHVAEYRYELGEVYARVDLRRLDRADPVLDAQAFLRAEKRLRKAIEVTRLLVLQHPNVPRYFRFRAHHHRMLAILLTKMGRLEEAEKFYDRSVLFQQSLADRLPDEPIHRAFVASAQMGLADVLRQRGDSERARAVLEEATALLETMLAHNSSPIDQGTRHQARDFAAKGYEALSELLAEMRLPDEAATAQQNAQRHREQAAAIDRRRT